MRLALVSLIALAAASPALAQSTTAPAGAAPAATTPPAPPAPPAAAPAAPAPADAAAPTTLPPLPDTPAPPPPPPPPPPTDPTAIAVLSVLTNVCIPAANGGNLPQLAKTAGFRKSGDDYTLRNRTYTMLIENPGTNPNQCHVDVTHPVDLEAPGRFIVEALHNWAVFGNAWSLYRNDKSVQEGLEYTTRSWQRDQDGKSESLVFTTHRRPDGTPMEGSSDASQMIYGQMKDPG